jgi:hypothetical protein
MTEEKVKKLFDSIIKSIEEEDNEQVIEICDKSKFKKLKKSFIS